MSDLSRTEAIQWCRENQCDFRTPVYPPPEGWMWCESKSSTDLTLDPIFTMTDQGDEITRQEVYGNGG